MGLESCAFEKGEGLLVPRPIPAPGSALGLLPSIALSSAQVTESKAPRQAPGQLPRCFAMMTRCKTVNSTPRFWASALPGRFTTWNCGWTKGRSSLDEFWPTLSEEQKQGIRAISMDMWDP